MVLILTYMSNVGDLSTAENLAGNSFDIYHKNVISHILNNYVKRYIKNISIIETIQGRNLKKSVMSNVDYTFPAFQSHKNKSISIVEHISNSSFV